MGLTLRLTMPGILVLAFSRMLTKLQVLSVVTATKALTPPRGIIIPFTMLALLLAVWLID